MTKKILDASRMRRGDIILTSSNNKISKAIRVMTSSEVSHAALWIDNGFIIDAVKEGVFSSNPERLAFDLSDCVYVLRLKESLSDERLDKIIRYAQDQIGSRYSIKEAILTKLTKPPATRKQFCSRLVAQAYSQAGVFVSREPDYCKPSDILESQLFSYVENPTKEISEEFLTSYNEALPAIKNNMDYSTQQVLKKVREIDNSIETLNDVNLFLLNNRNRDEEIYSIYIKSKYCEVYKIELGRHPWRYIPGQIDTVANSNKEEIIDYYKKTCGPESDILKRYTKKLRFYEKIHETTKLKTFLLLKQLYKTLVDNERIRLKIARDWAKRNCIE
ncbi:permuted papain-like amidase YaeF/Yiix C92 family enzyme [Zymomonas mobilis]|uniref:Permuted papain-like amidase YaeF/Yiix C92 family enzyme n=1 Tax=Zymomonas mobilis TaxID=542 RepID=A0A542VUD1_ZYMMB|nr:YiiX/YebB-like N1pC/P60 family cysteine hydrolase [Zymomonas mobilis]TQL14932.1 permuted papain-like amidase YaeF/Yiix C92 family enzyme [Zymomonas mobilis]